MIPDSPYRRALVSKEFHRARRRAAVQSLLARFSGQPLSLLSYSDVVAKLEVRGQSSLGLQQIPIAAIVGSVGRYQDFTRTFLPRLETDEERWVSVGAAAPTVADLPPIAVYKVGDSYFVLDGNHRVSLARLQRLAYIDAIVTEVRTRAPLPPGARPDDLIIAAEQASFLQFTNLDTLRPEAELSVNVPGQYAHLENHIEAYRFVLETTEDRELPFDEAVNRWFDEVYVPLVETIREQGILRYFPGRTETDFFIWLTRHRVALEKELGYTITPDVAVSRLITRVNVSAADAARAKHPLFSRLRRLTHLAPPGHKPPPSKSWAEERKLNRYSDTLFGHVVFPIAVAGEINAARPENHALRAAQAIAARESAQFCVLCVKSPEKDEPAQEAVIERLKSQIERDRNPQALTEVVVERGDATQRALDLAYLHDLLVLERGFNRSADRDIALSRKVYDIIRQSTRPVFIVGAGDYKPDLAQVLLVHDTRRRFDEALFIAAYLAERWKSVLTVLPIGNGRNTEEVVARIKDYLDLHEIQAVFLEALRPKRDLSEAIAGAAHAATSDLIIVTGSRGGDSRRIQSTDMVWGLLQRWPNSLLLAT